MKNTLSLIISLLITITSFAQQKDTLSNVIRLKLPSTNENLTKESLKTYIKSHYKYSRIPSDSKNLYKIGNVLLSFKDLSFVPQFENQKKPTLNAIKDDMSSLWTTSKYNKGIVVDESKIITVNRVQYAVINLHQDDEGLIQVYSDYDKKNRYISMTLQFKKNEEQKATQLLNDILKDITFKNR